MLPSVLIFCGTVLYTVYMKSFWHTLPKPFFVLAPLANVTDAAFRRIIAEHSMPDVMFTEFVSADGLFLGDERAREKHMKDLVFSEGERPIVAQFFTSSPERMERAARLARELHFDGIDINMGCPDRGVEKQGAGASLIKNPELAKELVLAAKRGAGDIPVSVKTRIGYNINELETWLPKLLGALPAVVTIHARTRKEMSKVPAHWDVIARAVAIRDEVKSDTLICGNGDVADIEDAKQKARESGADGVMLGRAIFGNPWLFREEKYVPNTEEKLNILVEHTKLFEELLGDIKNFAIMKKHFKAYVNDFLGAKELRVKLMETNSAGEVEVIIEDFLKQ